MKRRDFLRNSAAVAAAGISFPYFVPKHVLGADGKPGANDRFRVGVIGLGGRARALIKDEGIRDHADIVAVADCFFPRCDEAAKALPGGDKWVKYDNYHKMFEKEKLDAVFVETTTHGRALICIHAMQAGLDVYGEKPLTLTIEEGRAIVNAMKKHRRVFQTGTQQRSMPINAWASKRVRDGAIGKVKEVIVYNFEGATKKGTLPEEPMPAGLNWDEWCNQTPLKPYNKDYQFQWSLWPDYDGGGQSWGVTGWGTHSLDQAQCGLGTDDTGPVEIVPVEPGEHGKVTMRYANGTLLKLCGEKRKYEDLGAIFVGEKGTIEIKRGSLVASDPELIKGAPPIIPEVSPGECVDHIKNFFDCVRTRKQTNADAEVGHRSTTVCHLVNICRGLGRKLQWDPKTEKFVGDDEANKLISRPRRKGYEIPKEYL